MTKLSCHTRTPIGEDSAEKGGEELDERWRRYSTPSPLGGKLAFEWNVVGKNLGQA